MTTIKHSLEFETDILETSPVGKVLLKLSADEQVKILNKILKETLAPELTEILKGLNEGNSFATLKVASDSESI